MSQLLSSIICWFFTTAAMPSPANSLSAIPNINDKDVDLSSDSEEAEVEQLVGSNDRPLSESFHWVPGGLLWGLW